MSTNLPLMLVLATLLASCSSPASKAAQERRPTSVSLAPTDQAREWATEHARTMERNRTLPSFTADELRTMMAEPANVAVLTRWRATHGYYALLEIVEGIIEPEIGRLRRADVEMLLGKGDPDYPNSKGRLLHYAGDRRISAGAHVLIELDDHDTVKDLGWVSE